MSEVDACCVETAVIIEGQAQSIPTRLICLTRLVLRVRGCCYDEQLISVSAASSRHPTLELNPFNAITTTQQVRIG